MQINNATELKLFAASNGEPIPPKRESSAKPMHSRGFTFSIYVKLIFSRGIPLRYIFYYDLS